MNLIISLLLYVVVSLSPSVPSDSVYLCNGLEINNIDYANATEYADMWIVHFSFDDPLTFVLVFDTCWQYRAFEISPHGIEPVEF